MKKIFNLIFGVPYFLVTVRDKKAKAQRIDKEQFNAYKFNSVFERKFLIEVEYFSLIVIFENQTKMARIEETGENYKIQV